MKNIILFLSFMIAISCFTFANEDNFAKVGQELLAQKEARLNELKNEVEKFLNEMPQDGKIAGKEIKKLKKLSDNFMAEKQAANDYLAFYELQTEINLNYLNYTMLTTYYIAKGPLGLDYGDDNKQTIKKIFVEISGKDIVVEKSPCYSSRILYGILTWFILVLAVSLFIIDTGLENSAIVRTTIIGGCFVAGMLFFLFII